jgi:hypothetical protein
MAISVAMFGMTVGAVIVYLMPKTFTAEKTNWHLALFSLLYAISIFLSTQVELSLPDWIYGLCHISITIPYLLATYPVVSIPFIFCGICISLLLTKFEKHVSQLYAADLLGAATGCVLLIVLLNLVDIFSGVCFMAAISALAALCFAWANDKGTLKFLAVTFTCVFVLSGVARANLGPDAMPILRMRWVKFEKEIPPIFEKWNSFSRITVHGDPKKEQPPFGWGLSSKFVPDATVNRLDLHIDGNAKTVMTHFDGDIAKLKYLKFDMINLGHMMREHAKVLVIGVGAGRDILSALAFDQNSVLGVEVNSVILSALNNTFGDFSGHLDRNEKVNFAIDEARSYVSRASDKFDIIQISVIDTLAATASGAFVFSENSLYTVESWKIFLSHLSEHGVLAVSRWYHKGMPAESYRITELAVESLQQMGVSHPKEHILMARFFWPHAAEADLGVSTILVSPSAFSAADVNKFVKICKDLNFDVLLTPDYADDQVFKTIANGGNLAPYLATLPLDVTASTDDKPYFFHMLRMKDIFNPLTWQKGGGNEALAVYGNKLAVVMLFAVLLMVLFLTATCIIVPLLIASRRSGGVKISPALTLFFSAIGLGFMFIEISQMQRLIVLLGHPIYGLSVVLFSLLLTSGLGSFTTQSISDLHLSKQGRIRFIALIVILIVSGLVTPVLATSLVSQPNWIRIGAAILVLTPMGLFMGMAFPLGMRIALKRSPELAPWLWGVNGATSVLASVLAMCISLEWGISVTFAFGCFFYVVAIASYYCLEAKPQPPI